MAALGWGEAASPMLHSRFHHERRPEYVSYRQKATYGRGQCVFYGLKCKRTDRFGRYGISAAAGCSVPAPREHSIRSLYSSGKRP